MYFTANYKNNHYKTAYILTICSICFLLSCGEKSAQKSFENLRPALGSRNYGGVFRMNEAEYLKTLFPPSITDAFSYRIANQVYEGLLKFDQAYLTLKMGIAEKYTVDSGGTSYTFTLRKGVYFHDDPCFEGGKGREVTAADVAYCFSFICTQHPQNLGFEIFSGLLKGADAYNKASATDNHKNLQIEGIQIIDTYTIRFRLNQPNSLFLYDLARPFAYIWPREAWEKYGKDMRIHPVGTGPFYMASVDEDVAIVLKKFDRYYGKDSLGNTLPFLDAIEIKFIKDRKAELLEFKKGNFDMIYRLPTDQIIEILEDAMDKSKAGEYTKYQMQREPEMSTHYLMFNMEHPLYKNKDIRKAISYAIDRSKILEFVLQGEGYKPGVNGITPPTFEGYDINRIKGYDINADSARYYLKKAGYPGGKGFPKITLQLNPDAERNVSVAQEIQKQLHDVLNIELQIDILPLAQHLETLIQGKTPFFRIGWLADFPNPENFLYLFYGKNVPKDPKKPSFPNISRYKNPQFDMYYEKAVRSTELSAAIENFLKAEQILMQDPPVIALWYDEGYRMLQPYVMNFPNNPMQYRDLSDVYFSQPTPDDASNLP